MTGVIQEPGSTRPGRAAGLLLVGVAVIALVIGIITMIDGDGDDNPPASQPPPSSQSQIPSTSGQPPQNSQPPPQNTQPPGQSTSQPPPANTNTTAQPPPPTKRTRDVPVRIYNNGTIKGLGAQAGRDFSNDGWNVVEVTNYPDSIIPTSTAYFRQGTDEEAAARELAGRFNMKVAPRLPAFGGFSPGVVVMVTNDYGGK